MPVTDLSRIFKAYDVRGLYGQDIDGDTAEAVGRGLARALARPLRQAGGRAAGSAWGATCACPPPSSPPATATGWSPRARTSSTPGMVGTEMLYWLVGSRDLDGGLMCTASHNPKAYTGAKMVERGSRRAVRRPRPAARSARTSRTASARPPAAAPTRRSTSTRTSSASALQVIDPARDPAAEGRARRRQRHGRPDGRPDPRAAAARARRDLLGARRRVPRPRAEPAAAREPRVHHRARCCETGADLGIAWDGDADRCFFIDGAGEFVPGDFLTALLAASVLEKVPGADILYDVRASRAVPDTVERLGGRALVNRVGHAFFKTRMRDEGGEFGGEVSGHYYFKAFYNADSGTIPALLILELLSKRETTLAELLARAALDVLHLRRDQLRPSPTSGRRWTRSRPRYADAEITELDGVSVDYDGLALQRAPVQHRAAAAAEPREPGLPGRTWSAGATRCSR